MIKLGVRLIVSLSSRFDSVKSEELNVNLRIAWRSTYPTGTLTQRCLIRRKSRREMCEWTGLCQMMIKIEILISSTLLGRQDSTEHMEVRSFLVIFVINQTIQTYLLLFK